MSKNSSKRQRDTYRVKSMLIFLPSVLGVPAVFVGLINLGKPMDSGGFKPGRLAIIFICALTLLAAILIEKNQDRILKRLKAGRDADPVPAP